MAEKDIKDTGKKLKKLKLSDKEKTKDKDTPTGKSDVVDFSPTITEASNKTVVIGWGRMNPPTIGHEKLVKKIQSVAKSRKATPMVFLTQSTDPKKNPLDYPTKIVFAKKAFGSIIQKSPRIKTLIQLAKALSGKYDNLVMVAGQDRIEEFKRLLNAYNGKEYNFESIDVVSAGERDPDAEDVTGMSASKMRAAAAAGDFNSFKNGVPVKLKSQAQALFDAVRQGLKIIEELEAEGLLTEAGLTIAQRIRKRLVFRKNRAKVKIGQRRAKRRRATTKTINKRARRGALAALKSKFAGGKSVSQLSPAEKKRVENIASKRKNIIKRLEMRFRRTKRETERKRFSGAREDVNNAFGDFLDEKNNLVNLDDINTVIEIMDEAYDIINEESIEKGSIVKFKDDKGNVVNIYKSNNKFGYDIINKNKLNVSASSIDPYSNGHDAARKNVGKVVNIFKTSGKDKAKKHLEKITKRKWFVLESINDINENFVNFLSEKDEEKCTLISRAHLKAIEKFADRMLDKFNVDIGFTKHFGERMSDARNKPCIKLSELVNIFKRIEARKAKKIKANPDTQVVLKDLQKDLNMPVVIDYKNGEFDVRFKTIMRKKNFKTPNKVVSV